MIEKLVRLGRQVTHPPTTTFLHVNGVMTTRLSAFDLFSGRRISAYMYVSVLKTMEDSLDPAFNT